MNEIRDITEMIKRFRDERDWKQFHNPKDVSLSLVLEAAEVMEHFQWKSISEIEAYVQNNKRAIGEELADVLYWVLLLSDDLKIDIVDAIKRKMQRNKRQYPVKKSKGRHIKYTQI